MKVKRESLGKSQYLTLGMNTWVDPLDTNSWDFHWDKFGFELWGQNLGI